MRLSPLYSMIIVCLGLSHAFGACTEQIPKSEKAAFDLKTVSYYDQAIKLVKMHLALDRGKSGDSNNAILQDIKVREQVLREQFLQEIFDEDEAIENYERARCISPASLESWRKKLSELRAEVLAH